MSFGLPELSESAAATAGGLANTSYRGWFTNASGGVSRLMHRELHSPESTAPELLLVIVITALVIAPPL